MERAPIHGIEVFLTIVREGSMRAAAEVLGVGAPAVSLQMKALEDRLGVDLLFRTTRSIEMTDAGRVLFEAAAPAYRDMVHAVRKSQESAKSTTGTLRLSLSRGAYITAVAPVLAKFRAENPVITLDISWNEELVDIVREGFHAGIRLGDILAPDMIAVRATGPVPSVFFASPDYLKEQGTPKHPRDLLKHHCIRYRQPTSRAIREWWVTEKGQETRIDPPSRLVFDTVVGVIQAARDGHGVGWSMRTTMEEHLRTGELKTVLEPYARPLPPFYIYYPEQNKRVECLRLFVDCLRQQHRQKKAQR
ncbi:LysR family transcriptional regulator [Denitrobaculum tricleocarpae]|uniref:LysR family transcriptional regulator n=1 Tax=Denitrobaculum tricleocarpae TaxID=2591009 RepID=A0A545TYB2_9PROT|nr:LysR family transcriptional regulator [Denitrobaculum tricleocarpae]TQV82199.1 LysR family transcriptional regulator [Denitrobaculum tricleocarpae]